MARARRVVVLALVMFAIIGLAYAAEAPTKSPTDESDYEEEDNEFMIGTKRGVTPSPNAVVAAPIGGPVPPGAFDESTPPSAAASSISIPHFSALAGAAATAALAGSFFF